MMANQELLSRQKQAVYSLLFQGVLLSFYGALSVGFVLSMAPLKIPSLLVAFAIFGTPAAIPIFLGIRLYRGRLTKWAYEGWAGMSFAYGVFFLLLLWTRLSMWPAFYLDVLLFLHSAMPLSFLLTPWLIIRLTRTQPPQIQRYREVEERVRSNSL